MTDPTARRAYAPFLAALWSFDRSCRGKGGQTITTNTCTVCHQDYVSGSTAGGALCDPCLATLRGLLEAVKEDPTSRRAAMAEAIKAKDQELQTANFQLSQQAQNATLISALRPFPQPAYVTCSPYTAANGFGCGCNTGCNCA